jgi:hypothetical protein
MRNCAARYITVGSRRRCRYIRRCCFPAGKAVRLDMPQSIEAAIWSDQLSHPPVGGALVLLIHRCRNSKIFVVLLRSFSAVWILKPGLPVWILRHKCLKNSLVFPAVLKPVFIRRTPLKYLQALRNACGPFRDQQILEWSVRIYSFTTSNKFSISRNLCMYYVLKRIHTYWNLMNDA